MKPVEPIFVAELFAELNDELVPFLKSLSDDDWNKATTAGFWTVKDVAAHLLDSDIRRLSLQRDKQPLLQPESPIESYRDLVNFLNQLNADWIKAAKRISPKLLIEFISMTGSQVGDLFKSLDPFGPAIFSVAWAGEETSFNWFDVAREYTEKWHHQQQIRDAVGAPGLVSRKWLFPVLDTFLRALPHRFKDVTVDNGTRILFEIEGEAGGEWVLARENKMWQLYSGSCHDPDCLVRLSDDTAWRLMTKGLASDESRARVKFSGNHELGKPILGMLAIMG
jgi:uncharacterized protein (TIGR03083 family)